MKISKILLSVAVAFSLSNAENLDDKKAQIENIKNQIAMFDKIGAKGFVEMKTDLLDILEGRLEVENKEYAITQTQRMILQSLTFGFAESIEKKDYEEFASWLDIYKIEKNYIEPNIFMDNLIETKDIKFFQILKEKGIDKLNVGGETGETFFNYLQQNKTNKEIIKIFE